MMRILWTAKSAMNANQEKLDSISNNLANVNTTGYKKTETAFKDLLSESFDRLGYPIYDKDSYTGTGVKTTEWTRNGKQGNLMETKQPTDIAIDGQGYFRVTKADGSYAYTRDGSFKIDASGTLVTAQGDKLSIQYANGYGEGNPALTANTTKIDTDGSIYIQNGSTYNRIGNIPLYNAVGDNAFISAGSNLYVPAEGVQVNEETNADIYQGFLEGSNVDMAQEFSEMIITQRAFQLASKGITTADEMWGMVNNMRGR
ncbi:flagellar hook-basal body complex protein [Clostridium intestinale]|jgi:flagellar basal-body rod protein FlgG|uniref:Flagellar basal-body rod protein FlgG n=1 Tax=Clostridium intestinale DSM 6191 TaxID=1121320 RepID=A0A1M5Y191_9CLOT|nr:flagellar hook-basal body complex protein [Clostridium intestinale]SHI05584.1 flagellar basal-body rod protein FlgG [Clostridium intestinale DSM 6191]